MFELDWQSQIKEQRIKELLRVLPERTFRFNPSEKVFGLGSCFGFNILEIFENKEAIVLNGFAAEQHQPALASPAGHLYTAGQLLSSICAAFNPTDTAYSVKKVATRKKRHPYLNYYLGFTPAYYYVPSPFVINIPLIGGEEKAKEQFLSYLRNLKEAIVSATIIIITLSRAFEYEVNGIPCIRNPGEELFTYYLPVFADCRDRITALLHFIFRVAKTGVRIILTVSPIFHNHDVWQQSQEKSMLIAAVHESLREISIMHQDRADRINYFPSYEIIHYICGLESVAADGKHIDTEIIRESVFPLFRRAYMEQVL